MMFERIRCCAALIISVLLLPFGDKCIAAEDLLPLKGRCDGYNVVMVIADALRPDFLGCYGYAQNVSPNIDRLAKKGFIFEGAFSQASYTIASISSIYTSTHPYSHGVLSIYKDKLPKRLYTLAQIFGIYGYKTSWFGWREDPHSSPQSEVLRGFSEIRNISGDNSRSTKVCGFSEWIRRNKNSPFFVTIHTYRTHEGVFPFIAPRNRFFRRVSDNSKQVIYDLWRQRWESFQRLLCSDFSHAFKLFYPQDVKEYHKYFSRPFSYEAASRVFSRIRSDIDSRDKDLNFMSLGKERIYSHFSHKENRQDLREAVNSAVFDFDTKLFADIMAELKSAGVDRKTIVILTADHGNEYFEHGAIGHGRTVFDESIHVPLIFYIPGIRGRKIAPEALAQSIDIFPTLLELTGIPLPYQAQGKSLLGVMEGREESAHEFIYSQAVRGLFCIRSQRYKLIQGSYSEARVCERPVEVCSEQFYDLKADPLEERNLMSREPALTGDYQRRLNEWKEGLPLYHSGESEFLPFVSEKERERIRKTGYW